MDVMPECTSPHRDEHLHRQVAVLVERITGLEAALRRQGAPPDRVPAVGVADARPEAGSGSQDVAPREPDASGADESAAGGVSRRGLMRLLGSGAAVGAAVVGASVVTAGPAAAAAGSPLVLGTANSAGTSVTSLTSATGTNSCTFTAYNTGTSMPVALYGVAGPGSSGLESDASAGVCGNSHDYVGVKGLSANRVGVYGRSISSAGVHGYGSSFYGVLGVSDTGVGVAATSSNGVGGQFLGGKAQLHLVPAATTGHPTGGTHNVGELFLDKTGALYLCKAAGTPGTWKLLG